MYPAVDSEIHGLIRWELSDAALPGNPVDWSRWVHDHRATFAGYHDRYAVVLA